MSLTVSEWTDSLLTLVAIGGAAAISFYALI